MGNMEGAETIGRHRSQPDISIQSHISRRRVELGQAIANKRLGHAFFCSQSRRLALLPVNNLPCRLGMARFYWRVLAH